MHIIVGIDPGKTAAIACIDLNGNLIMSDHKLFAGTEWFVSIIRKVGEPIVIAGDKAESGRQLSKIAAIFGAEIYTPKQNISVRKKKEMAESAGVSNVHERDAFSAAKSAYNIYANKFRQAGRITAEKGAEEDVVKAMVVKRYSVFEAITGKKANRKKS